MKSAIFRISFVCLTAAVGASASSQLRAELVTGGFALPVAIVGHPTDPSILFVVEQRTGTTGRIRVVQNGALLATPFLSIGPVTTGDEQGLLGLAFDPGYSSNRFFYVNYTDSQGTTNIVRFQRSILNSLLADPGTATTILKVPQPFSNHNGGTLEFGDDGMLYVGLGDGGDANDPDNRAQDTMDLLGKMLRIDPSTDAFPGDPDRHYAVPTDNPFVGVGGALPEIWSLGLRNPWKYSDDPVSMLGHGSWLIGDVGQGQREEIDYEFPAQDGRNYGWRVWEGNLNTGLGGLSGVQPTVTFPLFEYTHAVGRSISGGYVYRGIELGPEFFGRYFYGDFIFSKIWSLLLNVNAGAQTVSVVANSDHSTALGASSNISTFGRDANGELYFAKYSTGQVFRIRPMNRVWLTAMSALDSIIVSGSLRHLVAQDGFAVTVTPRTDVDRNAYLNFKGGIQAGFDTDQLSASNLNFSARLWTNQAAGGTLRLRLRNWSTGQFVEVGSAAFSASPTTVSISGTPAASYRHADGRIEAQLRTEVTATPSASRTTVSIDQVRFTAS